MGVPTEQPVIDLREVYKIYKLGDISVHALRGVPRRRSSAAST
jgi:hypothetical protein